MKNIVDLLKQKTFVYSINRDPMTEMVIITVEGREASADKIENMIAELDQQKQITNWKVVVEWRDIHQWHVLQHRCSTPSPPQYDRHNHHGF